MIEKLSPRETDVVKLIIEGLSNKRIADQLAMSPHTVKFHVKNLCGKLGVTTRTEAAVHYIRGTLVPA